MRFSIRLKMFLAILVAVLFAAGSIGFVALRGVHALAMRVDSIHSETVLPLWNAGEMDRALIRMRTLIYHALITEGKELERFLEATGEALQDFDRLLAAYEQDQTILSQPNIQACLLQVGILEDHYTRETDR